MANGTISITVSFGGTRTPISGLPSGSTLSCIRNNRNVALSLGYSPTAVEYVINGVRASDSAVLNDGDVINIQNKAHEKAAA